MSNFGNGSKSNQIISHPLPNQRIKVFSFTNNLILLVNDPGACTGFLKGVGEELARSAGSEVAASEAICGNGPGAQPSEKILT